ncbi:hypothetical protein NDU88_006120 [Pleurodeles waltl]|uniref:Uncharacterized protein n=1 Tax=Pleurodeles waltl TaxID=8319 RepID=A0AAV7WDW4_PLEWA|nr:hypothetical protein NDU88_006120 [Pleurodeles waltl]
MGWSLPPPPPAAASPPPLSSRHRQGTDKWDQYRQRPGNQSRGFELYALRYRQPVQIPLMRRYGEMLGNVESRFRHASFAQPA